MEALLYYRDSDTKNGGIGAIEHSPLKDKWHLALRFPYGPRYGGSYEGKVDGAEQLKAFMKDADSYFQGKYKVSMTLCEQEISAKETGTCCYPVMNVEITGYNKEGREGEFHLVVMGKTDEKLLELPGMIRQEKPTV